MEERPLTREIILTAFIAIGMACAGCFLTAPSWAHLVPDLPARAAMAPEPAPTPLPTSTQTPRLASPPSPALVPILSTRQLLRSPEEQLEMTNYAKEVANHVHALLT